MTEPIFFRILASFRKATLAHGLQQVKSGAIGKLVLLADLLHCQSEACMVQAVQNGKSALEGWDLVLLRSTGCSFGGHAVTRNHDCIVVSHQLHARRLYSGVADGVS